MQYAPVRDRLRALQLSLRSRPCLRVKEFLCEHQPKQTRQRERERGRTARVRDLNGSLKETQPSAPKRVAVQEILIMQRVDAGSERGREAAAALTHVERKRIEDAVLK